MNTPKEIKTGDQVAEERKADESKHEHRGWIGVDLDGTLAHYDGWKGPEHIGAPVPAMLRKVKAWLAEGKDVRIFTARISHDKTPERTASAFKSLLAIERWCVEHVGKKLPISCEKDFGMIALYDDRCTFVFPNEGITHEEHMGFHQAMFFEVAMALGVKVEHGANFKTVADACIERAKAGNPKADQAQRAWALVDSAADALRSGKPTPEQMQKDVAMALRFLDRATNDLRALAGKPQS